MTRIGFYNEHWGNIKQYQSNLPGSDGKVKDIDRYEFS